MEADAPRLEPQLTGQQDEVYGHIGVAAEFARKRPVGGFAAFGQDAAEHARAGSLFGDVAQVGFAVGGEKTDALFVEVADVGGLFDGVAVADALRLDAERKHPVQFIARSDVETRAEIAEQFQNFSRRIRLDGVINPGKGKMLKQLFIFHFHDVEVDHQKRGGVAIGFLLHQLPILLRVIVQNVNPHCFFRPFVHSNVLVSQ